ncbi:unnamed protein product, partial [Diplocarpon coronariae]
MTQILSWPLHRTRFTTNVRLRCFDNHNPKMSSPSPSTEIQAQEELDMTTSPPQSTISEVDKSNSLATVGEEAPKIPEESPRQLVTPAVPKKLCSVCNQNKPKYKCSRCYLP